MVNPSIQTAYLKEKALTYDERRFSQKSGQVVHNIELNMLNNVLPYLSEDAAILEVGCGTGRFLVEMAQKGYHVDGTDASPDMLSICKNKISAFSSHFQPRLGEASHLPYPDRTFDFTYCIRLLNQTESSDYALNVMEDMFRVTKNDGYTLVEYINYYRAPIRHSKGQDVLLRPHAVIDRGHHCGAIPVWCRGAFFLTMGIFHMMPQPTLNMLHRVDSILSTIFPRFCTRGYILFRKQ